MWQNILLIFKELFHTNDAEKVQILIDPNVTNQNNSADPFKNLKMWHVQLTIATHKVRKLAEVLIKKFVD